jgi:hypothetical protein
MKPRKQTILIMLVGLLLVAFAVSMAQDPAQGDQKKKAEACCAMESCCCCSGDSCQMMEADGTTATAAADTTDKKDAKHSCCSGDSCKMKKDMNHADDHACCSCCGDSCDTNMKHDGATMKHDPTMKHDMEGHKGDCCNIKQKTKKKAA